MRDKRYLGFLLIVCALVLTAVGLIVMSPTAQASDAPAAQIRFTPIPAVEDESDASLPTGVYPGDLAPDFRLASLEMSEIRLSDYRGQKVLLNFFTTWCVPCRLEMPGVQSQYEARREDGWVVIGVDMFESREAVEAFREEFGLTFPIALDLNGNVSRTYEVRGTPTNIVIDEQGYIIERHLGYMSEEQVAEMLEAVP